MTNHIIPLAKCHLYFMTFITPPIYPFPLILTLMTIRNSLTPFARFAWLIVLLNLFVIVWGGYVSASGSGDGCGTSWPLCEQLVASEGLTFETFVEFFHRITSGLALIGVVAQTLWARRLFPKGNAVRQGAKWSFIFIVVESLLGAGLVLFQWVDTNMSLARAFVQPIHLVNTFLLMASLGLTAWWASGNEAGRWRNGRVSIAFLLALFGITLVSGFGTIASLASTIFPSESFFEGVQQDFARDVHYLIRLRIWHPLLAAIVGAYLFQLGQLLEKWTLNPRVRKLHHFILIVYVIQFGMGALNAILLAPIWLQLVHLLGAHLLWLGMILLTTTALAVQTKSAPSSNLYPAPS